MGTEMKTRNEIIKELVDRYGDTLYDRTDEELLGIGAISKLREDTIERRIERYREDLESWKDELLIGQEREDLRDLKRYELICAYRAELESKSDDELLGGQDESTEV